MNFDKSFLQNPLSEYLKWIFKKFIYQYRYRNRFLKIGYKCSLCNVTFDSHNWLANNVILSNVSMGKFTYVSDNSVILETKLGSFCSVGPNVRIAPGKHPTHTIVSTHPSIYSNPNYCSKNFSEYDRHNPYRHVEIGNDVWICANAVIADGVKIGDGAIIAANALVIKDVEPYSIVSGVPAKHIRFRFLAEEISVLLELKWWEKDITWIENNSKYLWDIKELMKKFDDGKKTK